VTPYTSSIHVTDVATQERRQRTQSWALLAGVVWLALVTAMIAYSTAPEPFSLAFLVLMLSCLASLIRPELGVYLIIFLSLIGDSQTTPWWPFTKNMSSEESIFYVSDAFSMTPMEVLLTVTFTSVILRAVSVPTWRFRRGRLFLPVAAFGACAFYGFAHGALTGHNRSVAILEVRPLMYLCALYLLITTLFTNRQQYRIAFGVALLAIGIQSLFALKYWASLSAIEREVAESLSEHSAAVAMNVVFLCVIALFVFKGSNWKKWTLLAMVPVVLWVYLLSQRRAAMIALFAGFIVLFGVLFVRNRRLFWRITPVVFVVGVLFVAATWKATGALSLPATAVKTVLFPGQLTEEDARSDLYRELEAYNLWFTIRQQPILGAGFGHRFTVVRPMPSISFFEFWQYLPHNSVLWVWVKTGYFGFVAMLYMFARAVQLGARTVARLRSADDAAIVTAAVAYVVMFLIFAYVDIGWVDRPAIVLALCLSICADFGAAKPDDKAIAKVPDRAVARPSEVFV
jgi:O-Antigen ligase